MEKKFTKHLIEIGIIDKKIEYQIISLYKENLLKYNYSNKFKFNELMTQILLSIFNNLTEIQKKFICFHLPAKFLKILSKHIKEKLKNILTRKILKTKLILSKYLFNWYKSIHNKSKHMLIDKNIFRQKSSKTFLNTKNVSNSKNYIHQNIKDYLFNNNNNNKDNLIIKNYQSNFNTLNNEKKNKNFQNITKSKKSDESKKKRKFLDDINFLDINDINFINNKALSNKATTIENKKLYTNNKDYIKQIKKYYNLKYKKSSNNETMNSGIRDSIESNENCISTNLNTINNRYNNQENKTLSQSEYAPNLDLINNYNIHTFKKICKNSSASNSKSIIKEKNNYCVQKNKNNKKKKMKNKSSLIQNILYEDFEKNCSISPIAKEKIIKTNNNNIYNLIYLNNYNNLNQNNYISDGYNSFNYQTPFCDSNKNSKISEVYSTCERLYEDSKKRIKKQKERKREQEKILYEISGGVSQEKRNVDYERLNYLYKSKERSNTFEKTKTKVELEEGLTFQPKINKSEYSRRIYGNFLERNLSSKSKEKCLSEYNYGIKTNSNINYHKKFNKKQKEKIVKNVINRLYENSLIKSLPTGCNKYTKGFKNINLKPYKKKL